MAQKPPPEFRAEAVRIALTSGLARRQVAADFDVGFSTLSRWVQQDRGKPEKPTPPGRSRARGRRAAEREPLAPGGEGGVEKGHPVLCGAKQMRFAFIARNADILPIGRLCQIMDVLAHIREQFALSLGRYGRARMAEGLKELGLDVGHRRVGRLMNQNGIEVKRNKTFKAAMDSTHGFNIAPNLLNRDCNADAPNKKWAGDISHVWTQKGGSTWLSSLNMAIAPQRLPKCGMHHTDCGSRYCAHDDQKILRRHGFQVSMSGTGNSYDCECVIAA